MLEESEGPWDFTEQRGDREDQGGSSGPNTAFKVEKPDAPPHSLGGHGAWNGQVGGFCPSEPWRVKSQGPGPQHCPQSIHMDPA